MNLLEIIFWIAVVCVFYTYLGYPLLIGLLAKFFPADEARLRTFESSVSVILAVRDEERRIVGKVRELAKLVASRPSGGEVIVVSDGSTDRTTEFAKAAAIEIEAETNGKAPIRVLGLTERLGKAAALNEGYSVATQPILVFADVRQTWAPDAIDKLVARFADPKVGAVSGELIVESAPGVLAGVSLYWRFEKCLRKAESRFRSMVSVTGSISAVRREFFRAIPPGTVLDDVYWPLSVALNGYRVVQEDGALAYDRLPEQAADEFWRKVRTLSGNFQLMTRMPAVLVPWLNPAWWQFFSHRVMRLVAPWALILAIVTNPALHGETYKVLLWTQVACYLLGLLGFWPAVAKRSRLASAIASFLLLNAACWVAFWVWASGRSAQSWTKAKYRSVIPTGNVDDHETHWNLRPEPRSVDR